MQEPSWKSHTVPPTLLFLAKGKIFPEVHINVAGKFGCKCLPSGPDLGLRVSITPA